MIKFEAMEIFPTQYSLLSASALKNVIEELYGLPPMDCRLLIHNVSDTYILEDQSKKYILKIYRDAHRKLEEIKGEVELLNNLSQRGARVSYPVPDLKGNEIQAFNAAEGTRYGVLFSYAEGKVYQELSDQHLATVGCEMAVIHQITTDLQLKHPRIEFNINTLLLDPLRILKPAFQGLEEEYNYLQQAISRVAAKMERIDYSTFSYGYCQYDFLPKNFHFTEDGSITFFDFDFAGKGYIVNDLGSFAAHYFLQRFYGKIDQQEADREFSIFLENYQKVRPLSTAEIEAIPYFGFAWWIFYLRFQYEHFEDWSNFFFGPRFLKERVGWIKKWEEWYFPQQP